MLMYITSRTLKVL